MSGYVEYGPFRVYMTLTGYVVKDERTQEEVSSPSLSYETALRIAQGWAEDERKDARARLHALQQGAVPRDCED